jgi:hypothetical protein
LAAPTSYEFVRVTRRCVCSLCRLKIDKGTSCWKKSGESKYLHPACYVRVKKLGNGKGKGIEGKKDET